MQEQVITEKKTVDDEGHFWFSADVQRQTEDGKEIFVDKDGNKISVDFANSVFRYITTHTIELDTDDAIEKIRVMLEGGIDVNNKSKYGATALMHVISYGAGIEIVKLLLEYGADVNAETETGWSPLRLARKHNANPDVIQLLKDAGAKE